jgi:phosphoribosylformylglycinamidine cyclo-ligase
MPCAVKGLAHITGGGLVDNVPRVLARVAVTATLETARLAASAAVRLAAAQGGVADAEMHRVFNCGIGMVVVVSQADEARALDLLRAAGETAWSIGMICRRGADQPQTIVA